MQTYWLSGTVDADSGRNALLMLGSVLHRRGAEVLEADLGRSVAGVRRFHVILQAMPRQAVTVLRSLESQIDVLEAQLDDYLDLRITG